MFSTAFLRDLTERAISTFAQAFIAAVAVDAGTGVHDIAWPTVLSVAALAAVLAVAKGVAAYAVESETGASLLSDPPPRVERGAVSLVEVLLIVLVVVVLLVLLGVL